MDSIFMFKIQTYTFWIASTTTVLLLFIMNIFRWAVYTKENKNETFYIYDFIYTFTKTNKELKEHIKTPIRKYDFKGKTIFNVIYIFIMLLPVVGIIGLFITIAFIFKEVIETILNFKIIKP